MAEACTGVTAAAAATAATLATLAAGAETETTAPASPPGTHRESSRTGRPHGPCSRCRTSHHPCHTVACTARCRWPPGWTRTLLRCAGEVVAVLTQSVKEAAGTVEGVRAAPTKGLPEAEASMARAGAAAPREVRSGASPAACTCHPRWRSAERSLARTPRTGSRRALGRPGTSSMCPGRYAWQSR